MPRMESRTQRGVDLSDPDQYGLARHVYYARFSRRVEAAGFEAVDGFQDCLLGLMTRNMGINPWDPSRRTLYSYLVLVFDSVTRNLASKARTHKALLVVVGARQDAALTGDG